MTESETPGTQAAVTAGEARAIVRSIVGTGIGLATLILMLMGLIVQQNATVNTRINDLGANMNTRFDDASVNVNARFDGVNARFDAMDTDVNTRFANMNTRFDDASASVNARFDAVDTRFDDMNSRIDDLNARIDGIVNDIRELRRLVIEAVKRPNPAE